MDDLKAEALGERIQGDHLERGARRAGDRGSQRVEIRVGPQRRKRESHSAVQQDAAPGTKRGHRVPQGGRAFFRHEAVLPGVRERELIRATAPHERLVGHVGLREDDAEPLSRQEAVEHPLSLEGRGRESGEVHETVDGVHRPGAARHHMSERGVAHSPRRRVPRAGHQQDGERGGERQRAPDQCGRQAGPGAQEQREPQGAGEQQRQAHVGQDVRSRAVHEVAELEDAVGRRPGDGHQRGPLARHQLSAPHDQQHERRRRGEVARADRQRRRPAHEVVGEVAEIAEEKRVEERQVLAPVRQLTGEGERRGGEQQVRGRRKPRARSPPA